MPKHTYNTVAGEAIEYDATPEVEAYVARVTRAAQDPTTTLAELTALIYAADNPILDPTVFKGRGAVTKAVLADPAYHVLLDLLYLKEMQLEAERGPDDGVRALTVKEVAERLGISPSAVRQAIAAGNLQGRKDGGSYEIDARSVETYRSRVTRRGPRPEAELELRFGSKPGSSFRAKIPGLEVINRDGHVLDGIVRKFEDGRGALAFTGRDSMRMFVIAPATEASDFEIGDFYVRGFYKVIAKVNDARQASYFFRHFEALEISAYVNRYRLFVENHPIEFVSRQEAIDARRRIDDALSEIDSDALNGERFKPGDRYDAALAAVAGAGIALFPSGEATELFKVTEHPDRVHWVAASDEFDALEMVRRGHPRRGLRVDTDSADIVSEADNVVLSKRHGLSVLEAFATDRSRRLIGSTAA